MEFLIILWIFCGVVFGCGAAFVEGKVNRKPARYKNALLLCLILGPIGFAIIIVRSSLSYSGGMRADIRAQGELARQQLAERQNQGQ